VKEEEEEGKEEQEEKGQAKFITNNLPFPQKKSLMHGVKIAIAHRLPPT